MPRDINFLDCPIQNIYHREDAAAGAAINTVVYTCPEGFRALIAFIGTYVVKTTATAMTMWVHRKNVGTGYIIEHLIQRNVDSSQPMVWPPNDATQADELASYPLILEGGDKIEITIAATGGETIITDTKGLAFLKQVGRWR